MIQVELTEGEMKAIDILVATGLYGKTREECAERLIAFAILNRVDENMLCPFDWDSVPLDKG